MNKKIISFISVGGLLVFLSAFTVVLKSSGEKWRTNSPWDGNTCSACHSGGATTPNVAIASTPAFGTNNSYVPNTTYTITVTVSGSYTKYGFNLEILNSTSVYTARDAGTFGSVLTTNTQKYTTTNLPTTMSHNTAANGVFSFTWTAPDTGNVYIYCAGLGVNNDGNTTGDKVKTTSLILTSNANAIASYQLKETNLYVYPNPATDNLRVTYMLNESSDVSVKIFNLNGELISDVLNEKQSVGLHSIDTHLPSILIKGIYMIKLFENGKCTTQKLLIY